MTVASETYKKIHNGDGGTVSFTTQFLFDNNTDVVVTLVDSDGVPTEWVSGTQYSLTGAGTGAAGTVTVSTSPTDYTPATGTKLVIQLKPDLLQGSALPRSGITSPKDQLEPIFDFTVRQQLRLLDDVSRSLRGPIEETSIGLLPRVADRATYVLGFDANGDPTVSSSVTLAAFDSIGSNVTAAAASATAAAASATAASSSASAASASATAAGASATAASAAAASNLFSKVVQKANADSPYTVVADTDDGTLFTIADDGAVTFNLPSIATAGEGERYGFLRVGASYTVTLARNGSDTINGAASDYTMTALAGEILLVVADDATPDNWIVIPWTQAGAGTGLSKAGSTISVDFSVVSAVTRTVNAQTGTTYTLALTDAGDVVTMSNASANVLTIPANASVAFAVGTQIDVVMLGAGTTSITGDTGVTVNGVSAGSGDIGAQYGAVTLLKLATDTWLVTGNIGTVA